MERVLWAWDLKWPLLWSLGLCPPKVSRASAAPQATCPHLHSRAAPTGSRALALVGPPIMVFPQERGRGGRHLTTQGVVPEVRGPPNGGVQVGVWD